ncbi:MAG: hypothetical protein J7K46_12450 [Bacteroidales bacterium]|nr:hypothetical protein [Bacteroidales bacterium]
MSRNNLIPAGEILKVHGLDGGIVIRFDKFFSFPDTFPAFVFLEIDGLPVPFAVAGAEEYGEHSFVVHLEEVTSRDKAARYQGCDVWLEPEDIEIKKDNLSFLYTGFAFRDETSGKQGKITGYTDISENPLFEIETEGETYLIPANPTFITHLNQKKKEMIFRLPKGIFGTMADD